MRSTFLGLAATLIAAGAVIHAGAPAAETAMATAAETAAGPGKVHVAHAIAMHGAPKYGADFTHFDYVNPDAPKGGYVRMGARGSFDSFNPYIAKGDAAAGSGNETLLGRSRDEPFTHYGLIAETVEWPEDRSWVAFTLRPEARWHDGQPITVDDVIFSLKMMKEKASPLQKFYFQDVLSAEKVGPRKVRFTFSGQVNRELPLIVGGDMPILPKHYWESEGRDFGKTTLEPPLNSGPYRIADFEPGRYVELERVEDYWGQDLPVNRGQNNFDRIRYDYYRDETVIREAVKAGNIDFFSENSAKDWATTYDIPALHQGWLVKERLDDHSSGGMQGYYMNTRRAKFQDKRLRRALAFAYDFKWTNEHIYYGTYLHPNSYFFGSELASSGLPSGQELEILEPYRDRLPPEVFNQVYTLPETDGSGWPRENLARAFDLLAQAGWVVRDMKLVNAETGEQLSLEFMYQQQGLERAILPFMHNLRRLGIDVSLRLVDTSQYINRLRAFDFDMIVYGSAQSLSPGNEQRTWWGSAAADDPGSRNVAGIKDPVVDALIEQVIAAPDRETLVATTRALDRVLLWGHYTVPNLAAPFDRFVYWNKFGRPDIVPMLGTTFNAWWIDPAKERALAERRPQEPQSTQDGGALGTLALTGAVAALLLFGYLSLRRLRGGAAN